MMPEQVHGWCIPCVLDVPATPAGSCTVCGHVLIPPSWGAHTWQWVGVGWQPYKTRPAGWHWEPPKPTEPAPPKTPKAARARVATPRAPVESSRVCGWCQTSLTLAHQGGSPQRYCGSLCKSRAAKARIRARRKGAAV